MDTLTPHAANDAGRSDRETGAGDLPLQSLTRAAATTVGGLVVDHVEYPLPYPDGRPWSIWGKGLLASNGRFYSAVGDHHTMGDDDPHGRDGNAYLYEYDPATKLVRVVGDAQSAFGRHVPGQNGYGKIHARLDEGPDGRLYTHTYWGSAPKLIYQGN